MNKVICFWGGLPKVVEVSDELYTQMKSMREQNEVPSELSDFVGGNYTVNAWQDYEADQAVTLGYNVDKTVSVPTELFFRIWKNANKFFKQEGVPLRAELTKYTGEAVFEIHTPNWWDLCWNQNHRRGHRLPRASVRSSGTKYCNEYLPRKYDRGYTPPHSVTKRFSMV